MLVGFTRYSRDESFSVMSQNWSFVVKVPMIDPAAKRSSAMDCRAYS